jgi:hypothetical protein
MQDKINIIYTDVPLPLEGNFERVSRYAENLTKAAYEALEEEAVLVTAFKVYHSEYQTSEMSDYAKVGLTNGSTGARQLQFACYIHRRSRPVNRSVGPHSWAASETSVASINCWSLACESPHLLEHIHDR